MSGQAAGSILTSRFHEVLNLSVFQFNFNLGCFQLGGRDFMEEISYIIEAEVAEALSHPSYHIFFDVL